MRVEDERKVVVYKRHNKKGTPMMLVHESKYLGASYRRAYISPRFFRSLRTSTLVKRLRVRDSQSRNRAMPYHRYF